MTNKRLDIGLLIDDLDTSFTSSIIKGATAAAEELDANLYLLPGKYIEPEYRDKQMAMYNYQFNTIFSYASVAHLDVACVLLGIIASTRNTEQKKEFMDSLGDIPLISLCCDVPGYPSILIENEKGFYQIIEHLIVEHGARNIGFVSGPQTNDDAIIRKNIFLQVMEKYGLPVSDRQIVYGNFTDYCTPVIEQLLDQNKSLDAIVFANDYMALAGYRVLAERGLEVGKDILVTGFDDESFANSMVPPLTTVKVNGFALGYQAVIQGKEYAETGTCTGATIDSHMILRKSCGCTEMHGEQLMKNMGLSQTGLFTSTEKEALTHYLFDGFITIDRNGIKQIFSDFFDNICEIYSNGISDIIHRNIYQSFAKLFYHDILNFTTTDRLFNTLRLIHYMLETCVTDHGASVKLSDLFYCLYRLMAEQIVASETKNKEELNLMSHRVNSFTRELISFDQSLDSSYEMVTELLKTMNMDSSYLYVFENAISYCEGKPWVVPSHAYFKAYHNPTGIYRIPDERQKLAISDIIRNPWTESDHRVTRILAPLFSNEKQYGLLLCELDPLYYSFFVLSISQISSAIRTLFLIEGQKRSEQELQKALKDNEYLSNISKIDELSKIYNRRGFYSQVKEIFNNPKMWGKRAILLYGDLDGLKRINDVYGHDEGDVAIQAIAEIMTEAFSSDGIISRFGGDEYAAMIITTQMEFEHVLLPSFHHIKNGVNAKLNKPYTIDISIGYEEFIITENVSLPKLLEEADNKLYKQKRAKKAAQALAATQHKEDDNSH